MSGFTFAEVDAVGRMVGSLTADSEDAVEHGNTILAVALCRAARDAEMSIEALMELVADCFEFGSAEFPPAPVN